jgi:5-deoxy-D-glucuronate isomerase
MWALSIVAKGVISVLVHNILPDNAQADCLLVVEVYRRRRHQLLAVA